MRNKFCFNCCSKASTNNGQEQNILKDDSILNFKSVKSNNIQGHGNKFHAIATKTKIWCNQWKCLAVSPWLVLRDCNIFRKNICFRNKFIMLQMSPVNRTSCSFLEQNFCIIFLFNQSNSCTQFKKSKQLSFLSYDVN